jgi:hypothetical protein
VLLTAVLTQKLVHKLLEKGTDHKKLSLHVPNTRIYRLIFPDFTYFSKLF